MILRKDFKQLLKLFRYSSCFVIIHLVSTKNFYGYNNNMINNIRFIKAENLIAKVDGAVAELE